jgi:hypothetical protein
MNYQHIPNSAGAAATYYYGKATQTKQYSSELKDFPHPRNQNNAATAMQEGWMYKASLAPRSQSSPDS